MLNLLTLPLLACRRPPLGVRWASSLQVSSNGPAAWLLIDGTNLIYRNFYAVPSGLTDPKTGLPNGAVVGVSNSMLNIALPYALSGARIVFVVDPVGKGSWRSDLSPDYKSTRKPMPDALRDQFEDAANAAAAFGATVVRVEGNEADDVIATLALRHGLSNGVDVWSGDKDLLQLLALNNVSCLDAYGIKVDDAKVMTKFGVTPAALGDYLAMVGDASDNVKGVAGIGPKGAKQLIDAFGTLDEILKAAPYDNHASITKRTRTAMAGCDRDQVLVSRRLVALNTEVELPTELLLPHEPVPGDWEALQKSLEDHADRHGFKTMKTKIQKRIALELKKLGTVTTKQQEPKEEEQGYCPF